jgi:hypothetical protein
MAADFVDVLLVALAEPLNRSHSADNDFAICRPLGKRAFEDVFLNTA